MSYYLVGFVLLVLILAVPQLRRTAVSLVGLAAIGAAGVTVIGGAVWGLYEAQSWLISPEPVVADRPSDPLDGEAMGLEKTQGHDATSLTQSEQHRPEGGTERPTAEPGPLEEGRDQVPSAAERARSILDADRKHAALAAYYPLPDGVSEETTNIVTVRIPAWRDQELAAFQEGLIVTWLHSLGLTPEETAHISTAKAWGALYDLWRQENPAAFPQEPPQPPALPQPPELPEFPQPPELPQPVTRMTSAPTEPTPDDSLSDRTRVDRQASVQPKEAARAPRRRPSTPRPTRRTSRPEPEREVGPFGF